MKYFIKQLVIDLLECGSFGQSLGPRVTTLILAETYAFHVTHRVRTDATEILKNFGLQAAIGQTLTSENVLQSCVLVFLIQI